MKSKMPSSFKYSLCSLAVAAALSPVSVPKAFAEVAMLEEVVVSARRRVETLQETPVAVSAFSADAIIAAQIETIGDLAQHVPGLSRREGRKEADLSIRGIGQRTSGVNVDPGVGVYVDDIFIPRSDSQLLDVLNMQSVEVLRGPQGTLFGKNTAGGAVLLTTRKPGEEFEGFVGVDVGDFDKQNVRAGVSGPVAGGLSAGIIYDYQSVDGYREDAETGRDYGNVDRWSVTAQLHYESEEIFTADLLLFHGEIEENAAPFTCVQGDTPGALANFTAPGDSRSSTDLCDMSESLNDDDKVLNDRLPLPWEMTNTLAGLTLNWDLDVFQIKSITGYLAQDDIISSGDTDATPLFALGNRVSSNRQLEGNGIKTNSEKRTYYSQEFQLTGEAFDEFLSYTIGAFGSKEKIDDEPGGGILGPGGFLGQPLPGGSVFALPPSVVGIRSLEFNTYDNESWAVFSQVIMNITEQWQITLGGRYTEETKKVEQVSYGTATPSPGLLTREEFDALGSFIQDIVPNPARPFTKDDDSWNVFTPAATVTYFAPDSWTGGVLSSGMFYFNVAEGFKAGGFTPIGDEYLSFDPEEIWSYELGAKLDMFDGTLRLNTAIYRMDYDEIQARVTRQLDEFVAVTGIINAGSATIEGAEMELSWLPTENLLLSVNGSYTDPEYDDFFDEDADGNLVDRASEPFSFIPKYVWSLAAQYTWDTEMGTIAPRISGFYRDEIFIGLDVGAVDEEYAYVSDYWSWNLRIPFDPAAVEGLQVAAYVNNMFDEDYFGSGFANASSGNATLIAGKQRTYGLEVNYNW